MTIRVLLADDQALLRQTFSILISATLLDDLTAREREIMALAAKGHSNGQIAAELYLSIHTVRTHIQRAMMKLRARDRAQLIVIAYQTGLVQPGQHPRA